MILRWLLVFFLLPFWSSGAAAAPGDTDVRSIWRVLDYIAVDYPGAVRDGKVISASEYAEMQDFAATAARGIRTLPAVSAHPELLQDAARLQETIAQVEAPGQVAALARNLGQQLLVFYPVPLVPHGLPDLERGRQLYADNCASCHGARGAGDGPLAGTLNPPPVAFAHIDRARERSLFALYQVISQGLDGTAMPSFAKLGDQERWALAFVAGQFAFPETDAHAGADIWRKDQALRADVGMEQLTTSTPASLISRLGAENGKAIVAWLRWHPEAVWPENSSALDIVRERLAQCLAAYRNGDVAAASRFAVSAYLDGFEPLEPALAVRDKPLLREVESAMTALRGDLANNATGEQIAARIDDLEALLLRVDRVLTTPVADPGLAFLGAFAILLREGLEALLIVVAIIAFLRKAERPQQIRYVHGGTVAALMGGVLTWWAATRFIEISGAGRELMEGFSALLAATVLVFVGIWMHNKSQAGAWQRYIHEKIGNALEKRSAWFLFVLTFVVVYREVFETILFYVAMWSQGNGYAMIAGSVTAVLALGSIAWAMLRFSKRLPIAQFFTFSAALMAVLAVILTGKGVAALQEANFLPVASLALPQLEWLGFYPSWQGLIAQLICIAVLMVAFTINRRSACLRTAQAPTKKQ